MTAIGLLSRVGDLGPWAAGARADRLGSEVGAVMTTLVSYATKMGGTEEIARAVGDELRRAGVEVVVKPADSVGSLDQYHAVVLGSAVYAGRWLRPARKLLKRLVDNRAVHPVPVWLFHSGPTGPGNAGLTVPPPGKIAAMAEDLGASPPQTFGGRIERETAKGFLATSMAKGDLAGDYRNFDDIKAWAAGIADQLRIVAGGADVR